jgi:GR25 family glycosyltransferase involved in LPS biosynthesis
MFGMPTYVISLKGREDRRKTFDDNWKSYDYEYVDAIDGDDLDIKKLIQDGVINDYFKMMQSIVLLMKKFMM